MPDVFIYPADDLNHPSSRVLHSPSWNRQRHPDAPPVLSKIHRRHSSQGLPPASIRPADSNALGEGGADIPDIPLRKFPRMATSAGFPDSPVLQPGERVLVGRQEYIVAQQLEPQAVSNVGLSRADQGADEYTEQLERVISPEPPVYTRSGARSPSTVPKSIRSARSYGDSAASSYLTNATSVLPALQTKGLGEEAALEPLQEEEIDPGSFDLVVPANNDGQVYSLERRSELLFSKEHMQAILTDAALLQKFTQFLCTTRPASVPLLVYYLDTLKALMALSYANAVTGALKKLEGYEFTSAPADTTANASLQAKCDAAFEMLAREDLPAYITYVWIQIVSLSIKRRIAGTLPAHLRNMSEGLAEVFCLTDPSRHDNPIIMASEEFHRTTQYGMSYVLGRNCRFLQGPKTNPFSVKRIREKLAAGEEHFETFLNYRRDGSPFLNLLLCAPLLDSRGKVRYFLGAQVDVSGLAKECSGLDGMKRIVDAQEREAREKERNTRGALGAAPGGCGGDASKGGSSKDAPDSSRPDAFRDLSEMLNLTELETVRRHGGNMHRPQQHEAASHQHSESLSNWHKPRILIQDEASTIHGAASTASLTDAGERKVPFPTIGGGRLTGVYENYLLVRPAPSLRILFASPTLRIPGILQSSFLSRIGGSGRVRDELAHALADGNGVTAKVRWITPTRSAGGVGGREREGDEGRPRWIHCTPLIGVNGAIGVWMVVVVDDEGNDAQLGRRVKVAPPVSTVIGAGAGAVNGLGLVGANPSVGRAVPTYIATAAPAQASGQAGSGAGGAGDDSASLFEERRRLQQQQQGSRGLTPAKSLRSLNGYAGDEQGSIYTLRLGED